MHGGGPYHGRVLAKNENISGTLTAANAENSRLGTMLEDNWGCVFIEPYLWPAGFPPFCGRPVRSGSPYCAAHAALCAAPAAAPR